jgi:methylenetetrahydrofolate reductase (NADPH)
MNGSVIPEPMLERLTAAESPDDVAAIGVEVATDICARLIAEAMPGLHLYPMNRSESIRRIYENLGL